MARFLFTVWPLIGHCYPNIGIALELRRRGHEVRFYTGSAAAEVLRESAIPFFPLRRVDDDAVQQMVHSPASARHRLRKLLEQRDRFRRMLVGALREQIADIEESLDEWPADVIVCDPMMWAPYVVLREKHKIKTALFTYAPFYLAPSEQLPALGLGLPPARDGMSRLRSRAAAAVMRATTASIRREANRVRREHGLPPISVSVSEWGGRVDLYLIPSCPSFDYDRSDLPPSVRYVGPCLWSRYSHTGPAPEWIAKLPADQPLVHVTEGTIHTQSPFLLHAAAEGLANLPLQAAMITGPHRSAAELGLDRVAPNIRVEQMFSYAHLLPRTNLVIATGGGGTTLSTLAAGVPMIVVPTEWDKPEIAQRVQAAGAGLALSPRRCSPRRLREMAELVLREPRFRDNARRLADELNAAGGTPTAATHLEALASGAAHNGAVAAARLSGPP